MARTAPTDQAACLALAQRQVGDVGDWTPEQWAQQLVDDSRVIDGTPYYRPYETALAYLERPGQVTARTEGDVSETYRDAQATRARLLRLGSEWDTDQLPKPAEGEAFDSSINWGSW